MRHWMLLSVVLFLSAHAFAEPPLYATSQPARKFDLLAEIRKIPPLKNDRGNRMPMILWEGVSFEPQDPQVYKDMLARGLIQHIQMDAKMIPTAQAIQKAGGPVIMMQGAGGAWPASEAGDEKLWAHQFADGYKPNPRSHLRPCPNIYVGWQVNADSIRALLRKYKDAGVTVSGVWMDWEGDPLFGNDMYIQASHCTRCKKTLPASVMANRNNFADYCWRQYLHLGDTYLAAPVAEVFPECSTTNWNVVFSTPEHPVITWGNSFISPSMPSMFTATNPVAYGNTWCFHSWKDKYTLDREHVDQFYTNVLMREVSADAANRQKYAPEKQCVPWVIRWCPDDEDPRIPIMTRERYREVLRHLWLRGVTTMQVFNAARPGYEDIVTGEVQDAVAIYDEMLAYREFLDAGEPMCLDTPKDQDDGVMWSGLRLKNRAVVRMFKQGGGAAKVTIEPFPGKKIELEATSDGKTYVLTLESDKISVK